MKSREKARNSPNEPQFTQGDKTCTACLRSLPKTRFRVMYDTEYHYYRLKANCRDCQLVKDRLRNWTSPPRPKGKSGRPEAHRHARALLSSAIRRGLIQRQPCSVCGGIGQAHHEDYSKPFEVEWLCQKHHGKKHWKPVDTPILAEIERLRESMSSRDGAGRYVRQKIAAKIEGGE